MVMLLMDASHDVADDSHGRRQLISGTAHEGSLGVLGLLGVFIGHMESLALFLQATTLSGYLGKMVGQGLLHLAEDALHVAYLVSTVGLL